VGYTHPRLYDSSELQDGEEQASQVGVHCRMLIKRASSHAHCSTGDDLPFSKPLAFPIASNPNTRIPSSYYYNDRRRSCSVGPPMMTEKGGLV